MNKTLLCVVGSMCFVCGVAMAGEYGAFSVDSRLRFETAEMDGKADAENLSLRLRLGYMTPEYEGFQAMAEGEFTFVGDEGDYNAAGVSGDSSKAVIADPESEQLDQLWLSYKGYDTQLKLGRQVIALDNQRYIGHVGWRQNRQTFDAVTVKNTSIENWHLFYGYLDNVVRIFGSDAPSAGGNASEAGAGSHLFNVSYKACDLAMVTAFAYLLELDDVPATLSSDTMGLFFKGGYTCEGGGKMGYRAEYARQVDAGDNPDNYEAESFSFSVDFVKKGFMAEVGYELLGSDDTGGVDTNGAPVYASFKTPLATGHKFNGYADRFLVTPAKGLEDVYVMLGYTLDLGEAVGPVVAKVWYHDFSSDVGGVDLGDEVDAVLVKPLSFEGVPGTFTFIAKLADYSAGDAGVDTRRFSAEVNYGVTF